MVTIHDETLDSVSDGSGPVHALTLAELKRLDAGYRFSPDGGQTFPFRGKGVTVPTLAEVTQAFPDIFLNLDMKQMEPPIVEALATFIEEQGAQDRILVGSFRDRVLKEFRERTDGRVATSAASWEARLFWLASRLGLTRFLRPAYDALQVPARHGPFSVVDRRFVQAAHRFGIQVHVWTVDESEEMRRLLDLGVDGLMSDRPDLLLDVLRLSQPRA
jgi:glycerophosphoryl diester phosphodiesterase